MKRRTAGTIAFILTLLIVALALAQTPPKPADITPVATVKLNPEASARWIELSKSEQEIIREANRQLAEIGGEKRGIMSGAGVPKDYEASVDGGTITFKAKAPEKKP